MNTIDYSQYDPFRRPEWRFDRVLTLVDRYPSPGRATTRDDQAVRQARRFLLRYRAHPSLEDRRALRDEMPGLYFAYQIYERSMDEPEMRFLLEARLLANQPIEEIAYECCTIVETVRWYEQLFFNVSDRLRSQDWIIRQVLAPAFLRHLKVSDDEAYKAGVSTPTVPFARPFYDWTLKLFGYFGGKHVIDFILAGFRRDKPLTSPDDVKEWMTDEYLVSIYRRSVLAAKQFEVNRYNVMQLFELHAKLIEIERSSDTQDEARTATERHIKAFVEGIPVKVGRKAARSMSAKNRARFESAAELRDADLLAGDPDELVVPAEEVLEAMPPPRRSGVDPAKHQEVKL